MIEQEIFTNPNPPHRLAYFGNETIFNVQWKACPITFWYIVFSLLHLIEEEGID